jgi:predicted dehydrogenase
MARKRYVQVGTGHRAQMYYKALAGPYSQNNALAGICDPNPGRLHAALTNIHQINPTLQVAAYPIANFERMLSECRPDTVIVTTIDRFHDDYICRAMERGFDVITEKPMTIDAERCQRIIDTQKRTGKRLKVTFNYRYSPTRTQVKHLLMSGIIGEVRAVDFHWMLDTAHGADYFRRWHRRKENSGGLFVHKATHHFDLVNWWLSSVPESVFATGQRAFYTPQTADALGLTQRSERCLTCPEAERCAFKLSLAKYPDLRQLYLECEQHDGYFRDRCVFSPEMDIEDNLHAIVKYHNGVQMSYSLVAFSPWEGYTIAFTGSKGRLEHTVQETSYTSGDGSTQGELITNGTATRIFPQRQTGYAVDLWKVTGPHGGGDPVMLEDIFGENPPADPYLRAADQRSGAYSILTGIAGNRSLLTGAPVRIDELVHGIGMPDYPPMPTE